MLSTLYMRFSVGYFSAIFGDDSQILKFAKMRKFPLTESWMLLTTIYDLFVG